MRLIDNAKMDAMLLWASRRHLVLMVTRRTARTFLGVAPTVLGAFLLSFMLVKSTPDARGMLFLALSLAMATVGVINARLGVALERQGEAATMRCLGATPMFVAIMFIAEALFLGGVGSIVGASLGAVAAKSVSIQDLAISVTCGTGLTIIGTLYPAWRSARITPSAAFQSTF